MGIEQLVKNDPELKEKSAASREAVLKFAGAPFPGSWEEWSGIGAVTEGKLSDKAVIEPCQLLGVFLAKKHNQEQFNQFLKDCEVQKRIVIQKQLHYWCLQHDVYSMDV